MLKYYLHPQQSTVVYRTFFFLFFFFHAFLIITVTEHFDFDAVLGICATYAILFVGDS